MNKLALVLATTLALGALFAWGAASFRAQEVESQRVLARDDRSVLAPGDAMSFGPADAPVTLVEWFDPGCETCRSFHPFVKKQLADHEGEVRLVLRYAPFHEGADMVSMILEASRRQDMYAHTLDVLFRTQPLWASHDHPQPELVWGVLEDEGLDMDKLRADFEDPVIRHRIQRDMAHAKRLGVRQTPTFFVNGTPLASFGRVQLEKRIASAIEESATKQ